MDNISSRSNLNLNYNQAFKSSETNGSSNDENPIFVNRLEQKFDRNLAMRPEAQKRAFFGGIFATVLCGMIALGDMVISGSIKAIEGSIKFTDIINPQKSMSKIGKWSVGIVGVFIVAKSIVTGILEDKKPSQYNIKAKPKPKMTSKPSSHH